MNTKARPFDRAYAEELIRETSLRIASSNHGFSVQAIQYALEDVKPAGIRLEVKHYQRSDIPPGTVLIEVSEFGLLHSQRNPTLNVRTRWQAFKAWVRA